METSQEQLRRHGDGCLATGSCYEQCVATYKLRTLEICTIPSKREVMSSKSVCYTQNDDVTSVPSCGRHRVEDKGTNSGWIA